MQLKVDGNTLFFTYDAQGVPATVNYNGTVYYYITNLQGDVTSIVDANGTAQVVCTYNAYGLRGHSTGNLNSGIGLYNPFWYRGYVYDQETGLYYLQSRYYDPGIGRFLNADGLVATGQGIIGNNMFAYCLNNPVCLIDPTGCSPILAVFWGIVVLAKSAISIAKTAIDLNKMGFKNQSISSVIMCNQTLDECEIDTPEEKAHFFSQCAAETNYGLWLTELGSDEYFLKKPYGKKYRGAGYIQLTWDFNYKPFSEAISTGV